MRHDASRLLIHRNLTTKSNAKRQSGIAISSSHGDSPKSLAHATGIGFVDPSGLKMRCFKTHEWGFDLRAFESPSTPRTFGEY
jgi:hypothetical protein